MKIYSSDPRANKASMILASMSPDIIEDIVSLVNNKGRALISELGNPDEGTVKPYAIFSRSYIRDEDFPAVFTGMTAIYLSTTRKLDKDNDFYERVLRDTFFLPKSMAANAAAKIETLDVIGGKNAIDMPWYKKLGDRLQEAIRRTVNYVPKLLGIAWENDQDQKYDIDFLYEVKNFGLILDDLQSRSALMGSQAKLSSERGLFNAGTGIYGDVCDAGGDPVDAAELVIGDVFQREVGGPILPALFGGLKKLLFKGKQDHDAKVATIVNKAGLNPNDQSQVDPVVKEAAMRYLANSPGRVMTAGGPNVLNDFDSALKLLQGVRNGMNTGDVEADIRDAYGDVVADSWAMGDLPGALSGIVELAGDSLETTGDPDLDEAIVGDVLDEIGDTYEGAFDPEIGGLFKRARANAAIRKGNRRARKNAKRAAKMAKKNRAQAMLLANQEWADSQSLDPTSVRTVDDYLAEFRSQGAGQESMNPEMNPQFEEFQSDSGYPDLHSDASDPFLMDMIPNA